MAIPLLNYSPVTQNSRVEGYEIPGDDQPKIYSTQNILSSTDINDLIEAAYRQIFFHAFKADREKFLESQLRSNQITVRDFVRGLLLSNTYRNSFYKMNNNYRFVEQTVQRVLGRDVYGKDETLAWSIIVATKGIEGFVDNLLDSEEYLENFGDDILPYQRRRVLPSRAAGELPFNIKSPRYDEYYRSILGFPKPVFQSSIRRFTPQEQQPKAGSPALFMNMARGLSNSQPLATQRVSAATVNFKSAVPYRQVNFPVNDPVAAAAVEKAKMGA
ncbi:phycobilisome rod-core linker polypeptide [Leptolyngbya sp. Heron Island J]|uniref:phycobilisome rod-core linker polypeptide n=1 Tax=Leptolyngbya sp. Heron Island J TaxID=1385935 RepID=UPI0003B9DB69|nr:phycobilisome rod-core linker polypeptide [Leptolyngbya sp. Heron Island J]ESA37187.1 phycobilisome rod-core linker polypeptide [Leptolyngbya sp. Heron Island J]